MEIRMSEPSSSAPQLLHLVFGGELTSLEGTEFRDPAKIDIVGIFPNFAAAQVAWRARAQASVDNAMMRYFVVHLHRFLDPNVTPAHG
jgi:Domain of unknown function (DUF4170)